MKKTPKNGDASASLSTERFEPDYARVTRYFREQIYRGDWPPGFRLPSIEKLAKTLGTNYGTIHIAMTPLVKEGRVARVHGSGTFVCERANAFTTAGVFYSRDLWGGAQWAFYQSIHRCLSKSLEAENKSVRIYIDSRPNHEQGVVLPLLVDAVQRQEIQCVIAPLVSGKSLVTLERLPLPTAIFSKVKKFSGRVSEGDNLFDLAASAMEEQNCLSTALITHLCRNQENEDFYDLFDEALEKHSFKTQKSWICAPTRPVWDEFERYGYEQFKKLWAQPKHPDSLIVYPDVAARGVVTAILELGVRVPQDLTVIMHRNAGVEFFCPLPIYWIESNTQAIADALIGQVKRQMAGEEEKAISIPASMFSPSSLPGRRSEAS